MRKTVIAVSCGGALVATLGLNQSAEAHIRLTAPTSRHPIPVQEDNSFLKDGPCGGQGDSRTSDPARVTTFAPGETITLEWHETIHHASHYRIAFDADGQDDFIDPTSESDIVEPPVLPILKDGIPDLSDGEDSFSVQVTLPTTPCDNCTLQLIQYMYDRAEPFYYQCADIVIAGEPGDPPLGTGGTIDAGTGGTTGAGTGGSLGSGDPLSTGGTSSGAPSGTTGGTSSEMNPEMPISEETTGCSTNRSVALPHHRLVMIFVALFAAAVLRRRHGTA